MKPEFKSNPPNGRPCTLGTATHSCNLTAEYASEIIVENRLILDAVVTKALGGLVFLHHLVFSRAVA